MNFASSFANKTDKFIKYFILKHNLLKDHYSDIKQFDTYIVCFKKYENTKIRNFLHYNSDIEAKYGNIKEWINMVLYHS